MRLSYYIIAILISISSYSHAVTWSVNTKAEITSALSSLTAGDTISVEPGTYTNLGQVTITRDCTQTQPCTFRAQSPGAVTFSGQGALTIDLRGQWWVIKDLIFQNQTSFGDYSTPVASSTGPLFVYDGAQDSIVENITFNNLSGTGVVIAFMKHLGTRATLRNTFRNSTVNGFTHTGTGSVFIYMLGKSDRGFNTFTTIEGNTFKNRVTSASNNSQYWIRYGNSNSSAYTSELNLIAPPRYTNLIIRNNTFLDDTLNGSGNDSVHLKVSGALIEGNTFQNVSRFAFRTGDDNKFIRNKVLNHASVKNDYGVYMSGPGHLVVNNLFATNSNSEVALWLSRGNTDVNSDNKLDYQRFEGSLYHNTFDGFSQRAIEANKNSTGTGGDGGTTLNPIIVDFQNNVFRQQQGTMINGASCATLFTGNADHNSWTGTATQGCITQSGAGDVLSAPLWTSPTTFDYSLQSASPLINTGVDTPSVPETDYDLLGVLRDATPDIGSNEFPIASTGVFYVDSSCSVPGNGTSETCDTATGPWTSLSYATTVADCVGMVPGDTLIVKGNASAPANGNYYDSIVYSEGNISPDSNCSNITIKNESAEHVVLDGTINIKASTWTHIGSNVYECTAGTCAPATDYPPFLWYRKAGTEYTLNLIQSSKTCTTSLAAGFMRFNPTSRRICVHLHDDSAPSTTDYMRIANYKYGFLMDTENADGIIFTRHEDKTGGIYIQRFLLNGFYLSFNVSQDIRIKELDIGYVADYCISGNSSGAIGNLFVIENELHHCGRGAIRLNGDTGNPVVLTNDIHDIGNSPHFEEGCLGSGDGCQSGNSTDPVGIYVYNCSTRDGLTKGIYKTNEIYNMGGGYANACKGIHLANCSYFNRINANYLHDLNATGGGCQGISITGIPSGQYHDENIITNNRLDNIDQMFIVDFNTATDQTNNDIFIYGNTFLDPVSKGIEQQDGANVNLQTWYRNNLIESTTGVFPLINIPSSTNWNTSNFTTNGIQCDHAGCSGQDLVVFQGVGYNSGEISGINAFGNIYGDFDISQTDLTIGNSSAAIDAGANLGFLPDDFLGVLRPQGASSDIGAHENNAASAVTDLELRSFQYYEKTSVDGNQLIAEVNKKPRIYKKGQFIIRFAVVGEPTTTSHEADLALFYQLCDPTCGSYEQVTIDCSLSTICFVNDPSRQDGDAITNRLPLEGRNFLTESAYYDQAGDGILVTISGNDQLELEFLVGFCDYNSVCSSVSAGDEIRLQVRNSDGTALNTVTQTPYFAITPIMGTIYGPN